MTDTQQTTAPDGGIALVEDGDGIVGFTARHTAGKDYQSAAAEFEYRFARPRQYVDVVAVAGEVQGYAEEQAEAKLADTLARCAAQTAAVQPQVAPAPTPAVPVVPAAPQQVAPPVPPVPEEPGQTVYPQQAGDPFQAVADQLGGQQVGQTTAAGLDIRIGSDPKGNQLRFVSSVSLPSRAFEDAIKQQIASHGFDPEHFAIFDNRVTRPGSQYDGLEDGGKSYTVASVKARNDTPWQAAIGEKTTAFYVDFNEQGVLHVKPSKQLAQAKTAAQAFAGAGA